MKIAYILFLLGITLTMNSCKEKKKIQNEPEKINYNDSANLVDKKSINKDVISLEPIKDIPTFDTKYANQFVVDIKSYFEQVAEASRRGETDKILELQLKANDFDTEFKKVKESLDPKQQEKLTTWYMQLVKAASN